MKHEINGWRIIFFVGAAVLFLSLLESGMAQDQNPPNGMDKGVWILTDKKPDVEAEKDWDNGLYYNNHVSFSGSIVEGGYSWKDGDDPGDCRGTVEGKFSWTELPEVLEPRIKQETTMTAEARGDQSCSSRNPGACGHLEINEETQEPHPCISFSSGDTKQDSETVKVSWEAPWGNIDDTLTLGISHRVPGELPGYINYVYSYTPTDTKSYETFDPRSLRPRTGLYLEYNVKKVFVVRDGKRILAKPGFQFRVGDNIESEGDSHLRSEAGDEVVFFSGSNLNIQPAEEEVKAYTQYAIICHSSGRAFFSLLSGNPGLWGYEESEAYREKVEAEIEEELTKPIHPLVIMRYAKCYPQGTVFVCEQTSNASILKVLDGTVKFKSNVTGEEILVCTGQMVKATSTGLSPLESFDVEVEKASLEPYLSATEVTEPEESKVIYNSWNLASVDNSPTCSPFFTIDEPQMITYIDTYHWNYSAGAPGGTIGLRNGDGTLYGPWKVETSLDGEEVPNGYWIAHPNELMPAGSYTVEDSDPSTLSQNSKSPCGFTRVEGYAVPKEAKIWKNKASALMAQGKYDEANQAYEKAIGLDPNDSYTWIGKGESLLSQEKYDAAVRAYERAIELDPNDAWAWLYKGYALDGLGKRNEAIQAYDKVKELNPEFAEIEFEGKDYPV